MACTLLQSVLSEEASEQAAPVRAWHLVLTQGVQGGEATQ